MPIVNKVENNHGQDVRATIDKDPFIFNMRGAVEFAAGEGQQEKNNVRLTLYDGSIVKNWYWGNLAFELSTMKMAKKKNPILFSHDTDQRLAISDKASFEGKFIMEGTFLEGSEISQQVKKEMLEGFPFESSLRFDPDRSIIMNVPDGQSVQVNGHVLKGPGTVVKNALIVEGSICVFGALKNTVSEAFEILSENKDSKETFMDEQTKVEMTLETFATDNPQLHQQLTAAAKADGVKEVRELFSQFAVRFADDPAFCVEQFKSGATLAAAVEAENAKLKKEAADAAKKSKSRIDPAKQEFSDDAADKKNQASQPATDKEGWEKEFSESKDLQAEFGGEVEDYVAFKQAEKNGQVK